MSDREPRMTVDLDIPHDAAERERLRLANLCECPTCGRMHKPLGFGDPPGVAAQNKAMQAEIERLQAALQQIVDECALSLRGYEIAFATLNHEQKVGGG